MWRLQGNPHPQLVESRSPIVIALELLLFGNSFFWKISQFLCFSISFFSNPNAIFFQLKQWNPQVPKEYRAFDPQATLPTSCSWNRSRLQGVFGYRESSRKFLLDISIRFSYINFLFLFCRRIWGSRATLFSHSRRLQRHTLWVSSRTLTFAPSMPRGSPLCPRISSLQGGSVANVLKRLVFGFRWLDHAYYFRFV